MSDEASEEKRVSLILVGVCGRVHRGRLADILCDIAVLQAIQVSTEQDRMFLINASNAPEMMATAKYHKQPEKWQRQGNKRGERIR